MLKRESDLLTECLCNLFSVYEKNASVPDNGKSCYAKWKIASGDRQTTGGFHKYVWESVWQHLDWKDKKVTVHNIQEEVEDLQSRFLLFIEKSMNARKKIDCAFLDLESPPPSQEIDNSELWNIFAWIWKWKLVAPFKLAGEQPIVSNMSLIFGGMLRRIFYI